MYILYLVFQLKSHAYMYESTPQEVIDEESHPGVLADILGSSSSSDDSSSSSGSDSDTSASGSIITTGKKIRKKMFKRRRKSSASGSSATQSSGLPSIVNSPSFNERQGSYWETQPHRLGPITSANEGAADNQSDSSPRVRDFVVNSEVASPVGDEGKASDSKCLRMKPSKKHRRKHRHGKKSVEDREVTALGDDEKLAPTSTQPKVEFADELEIVPTSSHDQAASRLPFNMRQLSARTPFRPGLPKMLSNNVFVQPAPVPELARRPLAPIRAKTESSGIRRTNSLPDRLNAQSATATRNNVVIARTDPLPPFQHQRITARPSETSELASPDDEVARPEMSRTSALVLLLISTGLVAICAEFMVDAIPGMLTNSSVSQAFIGLIILPIVSNAAEHVTAVTVAAKNKMDLAIGVAVGSSIQIALFVTPIVVLLGWILDRDMSLYFNLFETVSLFVTAFVVNFLVLDGRSNYLEGSLC